MSDQHLWSQSHLPLLPVLHAHLVTSIRLCPCRAVFIGRSCLDPPPADSMHRTCRLARTRPARPCRRQASSAKLPPEASADQIFKDGVTARPGTSIGTEDEWHAALLTYRNGQSDDRPELEVSSHDNASQFASNRVGQVVLPRTLIDSVNAVLKASHGPSIRSTAMRFYESMRLKAEGKTVDVPMPLSREFTGLEADTYLAGLMPQLYTSVYTVMLELRKRLGKDWQPESVLDCGLGPGTSALAFQEVFVNTNPHPLSPAPAVSIVELNNELRHRTEKIWSSIAALKETKNVNEATERYRIYHQLGSPTRKHDVILAPHVLGDLRGRPSERDVLARDLWSRLAPGGVLLLLERGNPMGFERVARARQVILRQANSSKQVSGRTTTSISSSSSSSTSSTQEGGHVIAPCPHDGQCPLFLHGHQPDRSRWCHFSQRLQRPDFLQRTKKAKDNLEDVAYSYVLIRKDTPRPQLPAASTGPVTTTTTTTTTTTPSGVDDVIDPLNPDPPRVSRDGVMSDRDIVSASYHWSRIILPPLKRHKHVLLDICSAPSRTMAITPMTDRVTKHKRKPSLERERREADEEEEEDVGRKRQVLDRPLIQRITIPKSQGAVEYRFARRSHWGDLLPFRGKTVMDVVEADLPRKSEKSPTKSRRRERRERE